MNIVGINFRHSTIRVFTIHNISLKMFRIFYEHYFGGFWTKFSMLMGWVMYTTNRIPWALNDPKGFLLCHNLYGVVWTLLLGTRLRIYVAISNASPKKLVGWLAGAIIDLTMSNNVRFLRSVTPFCCGVPGIVSCLCIPFPHKTPQIS